MNLDLAAVVPELLANHRVTPGQRTLASPRMLRSIQGYSLS